MLAISPPAECLNNLIDGLLSVGSCTTKVFDGDVLFIPTLPALVMRSASVGVVFASPETARTPNTKSPTPLPPVLLNPIAPPTQLAPLPLSENTICGPSLAVSYTHLTLPTIYSV